MVSTRMKSLCHKVAPKMWWTKTTNGASLEGSKINYTHYVRLGLHSNNVAIKAKRNYTTKQSI